MEGQKTILCCCQDSNSKAIVKCSENHKFHKNCLEKMSENKYVCRYLRQCNKCTQELLLTLDNTKLCKKCLGKKPNSSKACLLTKHFCKKCLPLYLKLDHYDQCKICKASYEDLKYCYICSKMFKRLDLLQSSECNIHNFCQLCVKTINPDILNCSSCKKSIKTKEIYRNLSCSLCEERVSENSFLCEYGHYFCESCLVNFAYPKNHCEYCIEMFEILYEPYNENAPENFNAFNQSMIATIKTGEEHSTNNCYKCKKHSSYRLYPTPCCRVHYYCSTCLNTELSAEYIKCDKCIGYFNMINMIESPNSLVCNLCKISPQGTRPYCNSNHYYCKNCQISIAKSPKIAYLRLLECQNCVRKINNDKLMIIKQAEEQKNLENEEMTFICKHSFRYKNIRKLYIKHLKNFIKIVSSNNIEIIPKKFVIKCLDSTCNKSIKIPFSLIWHDISKEFKVEYQKVLENFELYFDGVLLTFEVCSCGRVVGKSGRLSINCLCQEE